MKHSPTPLTSFRIKASRKSTLYWIVNLWKNGTAMQKHYSHLRLGTKCRAACSPYEVYTFKKGKKKVSKCLGEINLQAKHLGMELITHESCHAGLFYLDRKKVSRERKGKNGLLCDDSFDELLCYSVGFIAAEIVRGLRKRRFIE